MLGLPKRLLRATTSGQPGESRMSAFRAIVVEKTETGQSVALRDFDEADLMDGDVTVRVSHSTLNYKDGLAITGKAPIVRRFPMIPGVDLAGTVEASCAPGFQARRCGRAERLGYRRDPPGRLCREGPRQRRLADPAAAGLDARPRPWRSERRATPRCCA